MKKTYFFVLCLFLVSLIHVLSTYQLAITDSQITTKVLVASDPNYLSQDFYVQETAGFSERFFYVGIFHTLFQLLGNLDIVYFLVFVAFYFYASIALFSLLVRVTQDTVVSFLSTTMLHFVVWIQLGSGTFFGYHPNILAYGLLFSSISLLFDKRPIRAFLLLGTISLFHPVMALTSYATVTLVWLFTLRIHGLTTLIKKLLVSFSFAFTALIGLLPLLLHRSSSVAGDVSLSVFMVAHFKHMSHYAVFTWPITKFLVFGLVLITVLVIIRRDSFLRSKSSLLIPYGVAVGIFSLAGIIFVEFLTLSSTLALARWFRVHILLLAIMYLIVFYYVYKRFMSTQVTLERMYYCVIPVLFFYTLVVPVGCLLLLADRYILAIARKALSFVSSRLLSSAFILLCAALFIGSFALPYVFTRVILYALIAVTLTYCCLRMQPRAVVSCVVFLLVVSSIFALRHDYSYSGACKDISSVAAFAAENTPEDAVFLIPPEQDKFRLCAQRAVVVDITTMWDDADIVQWHDRLANVVGVDSLAEHTYKELDDLYHGQENVDSVSYAFDYIVSDSSVSWSYERVYEDEHYILYRR